MINMSLTKLVIENISNFPMNLNNARRSPLRTQISVLNRMNKNHLFIVAPKTPSSSDKHAILSALPNGSAYYHADGYWVDHEAITDENGNKVKDEDGEVKTKPVEYEEGSLVIFIPRRIPNSEVAELAERIANFSNQISYILSLYKKGLRGRTAELIFTGEHEKNFSIGRIRFGVKNEDGWTKIDNTVFSFI